MWGCVIGRRFGCEEDTDKEVKILCTYVVPEEERCAKVIAKDGNISQQQVPTKRIFLV